MEGERVFEVIFRVMRKCLDYGLWVMLLMPWLLDPLEWWVQYMHGNVGRGRERVECAFEAH